jgi:hypothetical protein
MEKERRGGNYAMFVRGGAGSIWVYLVLVAVLALLVVKGIIPEKAEAGMVACAGFVSALAGGIVVVGKGNVGRLPAAIVHTTIFVGVLVAIKLMSGTPELWGDGGWSLLSCILTGGLVSGMWRPVKKKRGKRVKVRTHSRGKV